MRRLRTLTATIAVSGAVSAALLVGVLVAQQITATHQPTQQQRVPTPMKVSVQVSSPWLLSDSEYQRRYPSPPQDLPDRAPARTTTAVQNGPASTQLAEQLASELPKDLVVVRKADRQLLQDTTAAEVLYTAANGGRLAVARHRLTRPMPTSNFPDGPDVQKWMLPSGSMAMLIAVAPKAYLQLIVIGKDGTVTNLLALAIPTTTPGQSIPPPLTADGLKQLAPLVDTIP